MPNIHGNYKQVENFPNYYVTDIGDVSPSNIAKWYRSKGYSVRRHSALETVTTIRKEYTGCETQSVEVPVPSKEGEDIVYSPNKYRETEGIKDRH